MSPMMAALDDAEGAGVPPGLPPVVDAHVHVFPQRLFEAVWRWFDTHGWPIRYRLGAEQVIDFLLSRGVDHLVALAYVHKPGMARELNSWMANLVAERPQVTGLATVMPGEPEVRSILEEAFGLGLAGVKLHCHVQAFAPDDPAVAEIYQVCADHGRPVVMHAGREPRSPAYHCDTYEICSVERVDQVLGDHPLLKLCIPHLGADEIDGYERLLDRHDNLWLDTTMMLADYFPQRPSRRLLEARPERLLYGTDFPNLPYAWDRELRRLREYGLREDTLCRILGGSARDLFALE